MKNLKCANIVGHIDSFVLEGQLIIIMELCEYGDLLSQIDIVRKAGKNFNETEILICIAHSCRALAIADQWNVVHCDIKPDNILVKERGVLKIADFGLSTVLVNEDAANRTAGTLIYMSPETLEGQISHKSDIWSLGSTIHEACCLK